MLVQALVEEIRVEDRHNIQPIFRVPEDGTALTSAVRAPSDAVALRGLEPCVRHLDLARRRCVRHLHEVVLARRVAIHEIGPVNEDQQPVPALMHTADEGNHPARQQAPNRQNKAHPWVDPSLLVIIL
jgi:hypothetical protein